MILFLLSVQTGKIHLGQKKAGEGLSQGVARGLAGERQERLPASGKCSLSRWGVGYTGVYSRQKPTEGILTTCTIHSG